MTTKKTETQAEEVVADKFFKDQILASKQFVGVDKDILSIVLEDDKEYTVEDARKAVETFKNKGVK
ncbi:hypothetical protein J1TS5_25660 [Paenibacillus macerans]|uniref:hypothetical protein n=1 Tax=Paenibacillus macerans TaxID=44252 RepID=UPI001B065253|nr:hypothetical protein [Paenibacillus macerans]GIP10396.1 hypothetical protein J1TS5_25660 [Paenibacillus macerans]